MSIEETLEDMYEEELRFSETDKSRTLLVDGSQSTKTQHPE